MTATGRLRPSVIVALGGDPKTHRLKTSAEIAEQDRTSESRFMLMLHRDKARQFPALAEKLTARGLTLY